LCSASLGLSECLPMPLTNEVNRVERRRWALAAFAWLDEQDSRRQKGNGSHVFLGGFLSGLGLGGGLGSGNLGRSSLSLRLSSGGGSDGGSLTETSAPNVIQISSNRTHVSLTPSSAIGAGAEVDASATGSAVGSAARTAGASTGAASAAGASAGVSATTGVGSAFSDWFGQRDTTRLPAQTHLGGLDLLLLLGSLVLVGAKQPREEALALGLGLLRLLLPSCQGCTGTL
jgi:hypothetical protein